MIALYVDDCLIAGSREETSRIKEFLSSEFEMEELGSPRLFLGIQIERNQTAGKEHIVLHQTRYIDTILERFSMEEAGDSPTPMVDSQVLSKAYRDQVSPMENNQLYMSAVGSLMYCVLGT
jgi:hypothetical protein